MVWALLVRGPWFDSELEGVQQEGVQWEGVSDALLPSCVVLRRKWSSKCLACLWSGASF